MEIKKNIPNNTVTRKLVDLDKETGNIYESINIIARRANQISSELKSELKKVVWPTPQQVLKNALIVCGCVLVVGVFIWVFDFVAGFGIEALIGAFN